MKNCFLKANGGVPIEDRPFPITGNLVFQPVDNIFLGVKYDFKYSTGEKGKFAMDLVEFKVAGSSGASKGYLTGTLDKKIGLFVNHSLNDNDTIGVRVNAEFPSEKPETKTTPTTTTTSIPDRRVPSSKISIDLAGQRKLNKFSSVATKLSIQPSLGDEKKQTGIRLGFGFQQNFNSNVVGTLSTDLNIASLIGNAGGSAHSLCFELKFKD
jgi:hypothetical protein